MTNPKCYYETYKFQSVCYYPLIFISDTPTLFLSTSGNILFSGFSCVLSWTEAKFVGIRNNFSYCVLFVLLVDGPCQFVFLHSCNTMLCPEL
jgi:hypothetical protein